MSPSASDSPSAAWAGEIPKPPPSPAAVNRTMADASDLADPESRAARTRAKILAAAAKELNEHGYVGTRLVNISKAVDIKAGAIYYYFHSLESIIEEVIELGQRTVIAKVQQALDDMPADASATDKILAAVAAHLEMVLTSSPYASASIRNFDQLPREMRERQTLLRRQYGTIWRDLFAEGVARHEFDTDFDPHATRMLIIGALNWSMEWWDDSKGSLDDIVSSAQTFVRKGLAPSGGDRA